MKRLNTRQYSIGFQFFITTASVALVSALCYMFSPLLGYKVVALFLMMIVSVLAMLFDIFPVLVAAVLSALVWNFFFIPPKFTFHIGQTEDLLMFLMYFIIALVNAVLSVKIRQGERIARDKEEKENAIKLYNTLINSLSHEIRTPLSTLIGAIDILKEKTIRLSPESSEQLLHEMEIAGLRLNRQVQNLLNMSRLESGMLQLKKDWCDVNELIFSVIAKFQDASLDHKIIFQPREQLPLFSLDAGLMENVLHNLVHNAIQYTPSQSTILISAKYEDENLCISIADNGKGFPAEEIPLVFDKFYRLPNSKSGGTGLGLSIAKGFVNAHHGKLELRNISVGGAEFRITIPAKTTFINNLINE